MGHFLSCLVLSLKERSDASPAALRSAVCRFRRALCGPASRGMAPITGGRLTCQGTRASIPSVKHWALARGCCAPLRTPGPLAPLPEQRTDGGAAPDPRTGARLAQRRTVVVAAHLTLADQAAFGKAETLRLQKALEPGHKDVSGLGGHAAHAQTAGDSRSSTVSGR